MSQKVITTFTLFICILIMILVLWFMTTYFANVI
jgi:hypothetical protein